MPLSNNFPASLDSWVNRTDGVDDNVADDVNAAHIRIQHLQTKVGADTDARTDTTVEGRLQKQAARLIVSSTEPTSPVNDDLWVDTSGDPAILKRWVVALWLVVAGDAVSLLTQTLDPSLISPPADGAVLTYDVGNTWWTASALPATGFLAVAKFGVD